MDSALIITLVYLIGTIFVVMAAVRFFNAPPMEPKEKKIQDILHSEPAIEPVIPKYVTERTRYYLYLSAFIGITLILYFFVSLIFPYVIAGITETKINSGYAVALVLGTLAFINFSQKLPFVNDTLTNWRNDLHKRAKIPDNALYVFDCLVNNEVNKSTETFKKNLAEILESKVNGETRVDIDKEDFNYRKNTIERKWARLVYLAYCLDKWGEQKQFSRHLKTESLHWLPLRSFYLETLYPEMVNYKNSALDEITIDQLKKKIDSTLIKVYWLVTILLFMANQSTEDPCIHLRNISWVVSPNKYFKFSYKQIMFTGTVVIIAIFLGALVGSGINFYLQNFLPTKYTVSPNNIRVWVIYGTLMFVVPLFATLSIKRFLTMHNIWAIRRPEDGTQPFAQRPWDIYFIVSFISYAITVIVLGAMALLGGMSAQALFYKLSVYCVLAFIAAMFICYLIDLPTPGWERDPWYYIKSIPAAILLGTLNVILLLYATLLFNDSNSFKFWNLPGDIIGRLIVQSVTAFIIGVAIYMTCRLSSKHYERRDNDVERSTIGWWTIKIGNFQKRVEAIHSTENNYEILADEELQALADVDNNIQLTNGNETLQGKVKTIMDDKILLAI